MPTPDALDHGLQVFGSALRWTVQEVYLYWLPVFAYALISRRALRSRAVWAATVVALSLAVISVRAGAVQELLHSLVGLLYYVGASAVAFWLQRGVAAKTVTKDALFCLLFVLFVALPAWPFRALGVLPLLVFGWLMLFSAYSYCVDAGRRGERPSFGAFLFFMLVDPSLVYPERAERTADYAKGFGGLQRVALGLASMIAGRAVFVVLPAIAESPALAGLQKSAYASALVLGFVVFVATYLLRAGLVSTQVGLLRTLGYRVPESYDKPYLAKSPREFWQRWNRYLGNWARRYLFSPLMLYLARMQRARRRSASVVMGQVWAALGTFLVIGVLHDALTAIGERTVALRHVLSFGAAGVALLAWEAARRVQWREPTARLGLRFGGGLLRRMAMLHYVVAQIAIVRWS